MEQEQPIPTIEFAEPPPQETALAVPFAGIDIGELISAAIHQNSAMEVFKELVELRANMQKEWAHSQYNAAIARFHRECPPIKKDKFVANKRDGSVRYSYASLDTILSTINPIMVECGLSYSWDTEISEDRLKVFCKISHINGHQEVVQVSSPLDESEYMSKIQRTGSSTTYLKRYALCNALGITADEDDDAQPQPPPKRKSFDPDAPFETDEESYTKIPKKKQATAATPELIINTINEAKTLERLDKIKERIDSGEATKNFTNEQKDNIINTLTVRYSILEAALKAEKEKKANE